MPGSMQIMLPNGAMHFGTNNEYVNCGSSQTIMPTGSITACAWINAPAADAYEYIFARYITGDNKRSWSMGIAASGASGTYNNLRVILSSGGKYDTGAKSYTSTDVVLDSTWHHVAFTFDRSTLKIYRDGEECTYSSQHDESITYLNSNTDVNVTIGSRSDLGYDYSGSLYDVRLYNSALTQSQIKDIYHRKNIKQNLIGHWKFNDNGNTTTIKDWSDSKLDGTMTTNSGGTWTENNNITCWGTRWDEGNWDVAIETFVTAQDRDMIAGNVTPGAVRELYNVLGTPNYIDTTYASSNTIKFIPRDGYGISGLREDRLIGVKSYTDTFINPEYFHIKIEGVRLDI